MAKKAESIGKEIARKHLTPEHYGWLVEARANNMRLSLELYSLLVKYDKTISGSRFRLTARILVFVTFSLWRAVFLTRTSVSEASRELHARMFLQKMIEDNTISFVQDQKFNSFSFRYYADTATLWLNKLSSRENGLAGGDIDPFKTGQFKHRWYEAHSRLEAAISGFGKSLEASARPTSRSIPRRK